MKSSISIYGFIAALIVLNLVLAFYATPVTDLGDASAYIILSKTFMGEVYNLNLESRSPLYSIIMAGFMYIFNAPVLYKVMVVFQYILVAVTTWLVYQLFRRLFQRKELAMIVALLFNLSFSTIFYANIILPEILAAFLLILSVFILLQIFDGGSFNRIFILGVAIGLLSLARFNAVPLIVTFIILLGYTLFKQKASVKKWIYSMGAFIFPYALIINLWCLYNFQHYGTYRLFPNSEDGFSQNIIIASIRPGNTVSEANKPVLEIFLKAREEFLKMKIKVKKGSIASIDKSGILSDLYSGYGIYKLALPVLRTYNKSSKSPNNFQETYNIDGFLREIASQNKQYVLKYRFYSLLNGFRAASGGSLPVDYGSINLNIFPTFSFILHKLIFLFISVFVFFTFFFFMASTIKTKFNPDITLLTMFFVVFSFWGINFIFCSVGDGNRYKFPAEPLIIGLFVYYICEFIKWIRNKKINLT